MRKSSAVALTRPQFTQCLAVQGRRQGTLSQKGKAAARLTRLPLRQVVASTGSGAGLNFRSISCVWLVPDHAGDSDSFSRKPTSCCFKQEGAICFLPTSQDSTAQPALPAEASCLELQLAEGPDLGATNSPGHLTDLVIPRRCQLRAS